MLQELDLVIRFSINGAELYPNPTQYSAIQKAATDIIFGALVSDIAEPKVKRKYVKKLRGKLARWTVEEIRFVNARRAEGMRWAKIVKELNAIYGNKRTVGGLYQFFKKGRTPVEVKADPNAVVPNNVPPLKTNEWGGTEGVKSPLGDL